MTGCALAYLSPHWTSKLKRFGDYHTNRVPEAMPVTTALPVQDLTTVAGVFTGILQAGLAVRAQPFDGDPGKIGPSPTVLIPENSKK